MTKVREPTEYPSDRTPRPGDQVIGPLGAVTTRGEWARAIADEPRRRKQALAQGLLASTEEAATIRADLKRLEHEESEARAELAALLKDADELVQLSFVPVVDRWRNLRVAVINRRDDVRRCHESIERTRAQLAEL